MQINGLFSELAGATPRSLRTAALKLTYVGPQKKPIPSVLVSTWYRLAALADFEPLESAGLNYANDATALLHFTVDDTVMGRIMAGVGTGAVSGNVLPVTGGAEHAGGGQAVLAVIAHLASSDGADAPLRGVELLLPANAALACATAIAAALDSGDGTGRDVMAIFMQAAFGVVLDRSANTNAGRAAGTP